MNNSASPPVLGKFFANSESDFAAVADAVTALSSIPEIDLEYSFIAFPNGLSCLLNVVKSDFPVKYLKIPPLLGRFEANSDKADAAVADASTAFASIPEIDFE